MSSYKLSAEVAVALNKLFLSKICSPVNHSSARGPTIVPIEVKSGQTGTLKSLHLFVNERALHTGVRLNLDVPSIVRCTGALPTGERYDYNLVSLPCYMVGEIDRLLDALPANA